MSHEQVILWDRVAGKQMRTLLGHAGSVNSCAFVPGVQVRDASGLNRMISRTSCSNQCTFIALPYACMGLLVLQGSAPCLLSASKDGMARLWDVSSGQCLSVKAVPGGQCLCVDVLSHESLRDGWRVKGWKHSFDNVACISTDKVSGAFRVCLCSCMHGTVRQSQLKTA